MSDLFKLVVSGGTDYTNYDQMRTYLDKVLNHKAPNVVIYTGTSAGAEYLAAQYAQERDYETRIFVMDTLTHGVQAKYIRNVSMIQEADAVVVFWDDIDKSTEHCLKTADRFSIPHRVVYYAPTYTSPFHV